MSASKITPDKEAETASVSTSQKPHRLSSYTDILSGDGNNNDESCSNGLDAGDHAWEDEKCKLIQRRLLKRYSSNEDFHRDQFQKPPARIPVKSICMAVVLLIAGFCLLTFAALVLFGKLNDKFADRVWPLIIMGLMMFIPGAYHVRIAIYASSGTPGFHFEDIPEFE